MNHYKSHAWHLFVVRCEQRDEVRAFLSAQGIETLIHYPIPPHKQIAYSCFNNLRLPLTEELHQQVLSLPIMSTMSHDEIMHVITTVNKF
ncbi:DegT/DnrJ/EryC1/StrS family aminotransferase [Aeromonas veronii]|uniref:DegT/DnrJ/EryC1/StrS family aminotransferase n=1 Tax=Aeromonas veronii TaxID=654 RepID=UPI003D20EEBF